MLRRPDRGHALEEKSVNEHSLYLLGIGIVAVFGLATFPLLFFVTAPYGRHRRSGWGPMIDARAGWVLQESPSVLLMAWVFFQGPNAFNVAPLVLLAIWQAHYVQRTFIFPFIMRMKGKKDPVATMSMAIAFNCVNASINAYAISHSPLTAETSWLWDPRFIIGVALFITGYFINRHSDAILRNLRNPGESGYKIPKGGLFRFVTSPNYFGEILEWGGWAIASWSLGGLAFFLFTAANLVPRARAHHRWYLEKFDDYPRERKRVFPFIY